MPTPSFPIAQSNNQSNNQSEKKGLFLKYQDFKKLERIIEDYNFNDETQQIDFNQMKSDEKEILWKIKTIIRNMESVRLRVRETEKKDEEGE